MAVQSIESRYQYYTSGQQGSQDEHATRPMDSRDVAKGPRSKHPGGPHQFTDSLPYLVSETYVEHYAAAHQAAYDDDYSHDMSVSTSSLHNQHLVDRLLQPH